MLHKDHPLYQEELAYICGMSGIERLHGRRVVVTGSTGLLGTMLIDALLLLPQRGIDVDVIAVGRSTARAYERLGEHFGNTHFTFLEQDVTCPFPESLQADYIFPLASNTHPIAYSTYPIATMTTNLYGAIHALDLAARTGAMVIYPSSVEIYGNNTTDVAFTETMTGQLTLATSRAGYTESKRCAEALCQCYSAERGVSVRLARLCRLLGPTLLPTDSKAATQFLGNALRHEDIVLKSAGTQLFSYIYACDAITAMLHILFYGTDNEAYNVAHPMCDILLRDFAAACAAVAGTKVIFDLPSAVEQRGFSIAQRATIDSSKLQALGWQPRYTITDAIARTLAILRE